jgi:hypothetical protein
MMKALLMNRRVRFSAFGLVILILAVLVWWNGYYSHKMAVSNELVTAYETSLHRLERLYAQKEALEKENLVNRDKQEDLKRLSDLLIEGDTVEDVNTEAQKLLRTFWDSQKIKLDSYKQIPGGKWRDASLIRISYQFKCELTDLSSLLQYFETLEKVIRIDSLNIHYVKVDQANLQVILNLGILLVSSDGV